MRARRCSLDAAPWVGGWWPLGAPLARSRGPIHLGIATQRAQRVARPVGRAQGNADPHLYSLLGSCPQRKSPEGTVEEGGT